ncbi:hypothetical protein RCL_jg3265.t2 [Rhizophagus clarus]|uniref:Uncharacterized protein n=1 Tax=Rhizophagus clarus TaxID=94130 RepID=A0A8H3MA72_9GLOM|nr:hypothetical protein RCL_jg3265.t2 [Rhizophagus clarus]
MVSRRITGGSWNIRNYIPDLTIHELSSLKKKQADPFMDQLNHSHMCLLLGQWEERFNFSLSKPWFLLSKPLISYRYTTSSLFSPASFSNSQSLRAFLIYYLH